MMPPCFNGEATTPTPFWSVTDNGGGASLILTVAPDAVHLCNNCGRYHISALDTLQTASPFTIRRLATSLFQLADQLEAGSTQKVH